jgi:hypothetical protein
LWNGEGESRLESSVQHKGPQTDAHVPGEYLSGVTTSEELGFSNNQSSEGLRAARACWGVEECAISLFTQ